MGAEEGEYVGEGLVGEGEGQSWMNRLRRLWAISVREVSGAKEVSGGGRTLDVGFGAFVLQGPAGGESRAFGFGSGGGLLGSPGETVGVGEG